MKNVSKNFAPLLAGMTLALLPSCGMDWFKGNSSCSGSSCQQIAPGEYDDNNDDGSDVLATLDGKALVTKNMLETEKHKLLESNPQLQQMIALMDEKQLDRNLVDGIASREMIRKYIADNKINKSEKYANDYATVLNQVTDALNTRHFMENLNVAVSDADVQKFYNEKKDVIPNLLVSQGGIEAVGVSFKDEKSAKDYAEKMRAAKHDMNTVAKEEGVASRVKDFNLVNENSLGIDADLKAKIVAIKQVPSTQQFKVGNEHWVVAAVKKEDVQYVPFGDVKDQLKEMVQKEQTMERFEKEIQKLKQDYKVVINQDFFAEQNPQAAMELTAQGESATDEVDAVAPAPAQAA